MIQKVVAYITHEKKLLVFRHTDFPEAGIQVPAGTVEQGEVLEHAVVREVVEETGLEQLDVAAYLGTDEIDKTLFNDIGVIRRHFFHLVVEQDVPMRWRHFERSASDGSVEPIEFELYWVDFPIGCRN